MRQRRRAVALNGSTVLEAESVLARVASVALSWRSRLVQLTAQLSQRGILETAQPQAHCPPAINCLLSCPPIKDSLPSNALTPVTRSGAADCSIRCFSEAS
uniref:Uncharacterized protein n=1 Tax=Vespula pensylvanica TaxID=30213 RepID=A0A834PGQ3_VESPE|nr:hypothetical protein H0235_001967 [Vespula pensylvanica]